MRRTESRDALHGDLCVASFVWNAEEDGTIPAGASWLRGAVPEDSIAIGGYIHCLLEVAESFDLFFGAQPLGTIVGPLTPGWYEFSALFESPPTYFRVDFEPDSRLRIESASPIAAGQFAIYVFYIYAEARQPDIPGPFAEDELLLDDGVFFVLQDNNLFKFLINT